MMYTGRMLLMTLQQWEIKARWKCAVTRLFTVWLGCRSVPVRQWKSTITLTLYHFSYIN